MDGGEDDLEELELPEPAATHSKKVCIHIKCISIVKKIKINKLVTMHIHHCR